MIESFTMLFRWSTKALDPVAASQAMRMQIIHFQMEQTFKRFKPWPGQNIYTGIMKSSRHQEPVWQSELN